MAVGKSQLSEQNIFRSQERHISIINRGGYQLAVCDLCQKRRAAHYHEIVYRAITVANEEARQISYSKELCALLCAECHIGVDNAHNWQTGIKLIQKNIDMYGLEAVLEKFLALQSAMNTALPYELTSFLIKENNK